MKNRINKHFDFTIPVSAFAASHSEVNTVLKGEIEISGVGYFWHREEDRERFDYDVENIRLNGIDVKDTLETFNGDVRNNEQFDTLVRAHLEYLFADEIAFSNSNKVAA